MLCKKNVSCATEHIYSAKILCNDEKCVRSTCVYNHIFVDLQEFEMYNLRILCRDYEHWKCRGKILFLIFNLYKDIKVELCLYSKHKLIP
jgi:hypothetical protein